MDWANSNYHLGLNGAAVLALHIVAFLVIGGFTSNVGRSVKK